MKRILFVLSTIAIFCPNVYAQAGCTVRVDLRWYSQSNELVFQPTGGVLRQPEWWSVVKDGAGELYWKEAAKNKYADICLDSKQADYFALWTSGTRRNVPKNQSEAVAVQVFPRSESGCLFVESVFHISKFSKDEERSAKEAFEGALIFFRMQPKPHVPSGTACVPVEAALKAMGEQSEQPDASGAPSEPLISTPGAGATILDISSIPTGADIVLDGQFVGSTPSSINVSAGEHTVSVSKPGYRAWERRLTAHSGTITVSAELEQLAAPTPQQR